MGWAEKVLAVSCSLPALESLFGTSSPAGSKETHGGVSMRALCWLNPCGFREESSGFSEAWFHPQPSVDGGLCHQETSQSGDGNVNACLDLTERP